MATERAQSFIDRADAAASVAAFQKVYRDAAAADQASPFTDEEKHALAAAFNAAVVRLVAL